MHEVEGLFCKTVNPGKLDKFAGQEKKRYGPHLHLLGQQRGSCSPRHLGRLGGAAHAGAGAELGQAGEEKADRGGGAGPGAVNGFDEALLSHLNNRSSSRRFRRRTAGLGAKAGRRLVAGGLARGGSGAGAEELRSRRRQREAGDGCCSLCSTRARERCERRRTGAPRERARGRGGSGARARRRSTGGRQGRGRGAARSGVHGAAAAAGRAGEEGDPGGGLLARSAAPWLPARRGRDERGI